MDIGESISIAMQSNEDCPMEHDEPVPIESQPAKGEKDVEILKKNMRDGKGTILFDVDDDGKMEDVGLNAYTTKEPTPEKALTKTDKNPIKFGDGEYPLSMAAHHVIPGKASLPDSNLAEFIWKSEGKIFSDIGYHVDGAENGVWLPTHGKLSSRMSKGTIKVDGQPMKYAEASTSGRAAEESTGAASFIRSYTQKAMDLTNAQFHDSHTEYSGKVMEKLDAIHAWVLKASGDDCSDCEKAKSPDGKLPPPHLLAFRLNALSKHLRTFLLGPPVMWRAPLFTSKYANEYKEIDEKFRKYRGRRLMAHWMMECFQAETGPGRPVGGPRRVPGVDSWILGEPLAVTPPEPIVLHWHPEETEGQPKHLYKAGVPIMTHRLHEELLAAGVDNLEVFRAEVRDEAAGTANSYLAFNVVGAIAAADMGLSKYSTGGGPAMYAVDFESVVLNEERIKDALLFRLAQNLTAIVVHDRVKERLEKAALGLAFIAPEEWVG